MGLVGIRQMRRRAMLVCVAATLVLGSVPVASAADPVAIAGMPTTLSTGPVELNPKPVGYAMDVSATIIPAAATGTVTFYDDQSGTRTSIGSAPLQPHPYVMDMTWAKITIPVDQAVGTYHIVAVYSGDAAYAASEAEPLAFVVGPRPSVTHVAVSAPHDDTGAIAQAGDIVTVTVDVLDGGAYYPGNPLPFAGTMTLKVDGATVATPYIASSTEVPTTGLALGAHTIRAEFASTSNVLHGSFAETSITVVPGSVDATGVGVSSTMFYPYKDGYRDTVLIRGTRNELASVSIKVYSPRSKLVKSASVAAGTGAYAYPWNGRNGAGRILAAGRYRVVQVLRDTTGATRTVTSYVTLSAKRIYTYTKTLKKSLSQRSAGSPSVGWVGWRFTLPSATVYKKLVFGVYGRSKTVSKSHFGPHDFRACSVSRWDPNACPNPYGYTNLSASWSNRSGSLTYNRSGRTVKLYAAALNSTAYVTHGRVVVTYGVLK